MDDERKKVEADSLDSSSFYTETRIEETTKIVYHAVSKKSANYDSESHASSSSTKPHQPPQKTHAPLTNAAVRHYGYRMRLYCRNGYNLLISPDKTVRGDAYGNNSSGVLEFSSAGIGEVRIRGVEANLYLAMSKTGTLYGEENPYDYATVFVEGTYGQYNTYLSQKYAHNGWYVGIKKNGTAKRGPRTKWGQKAIQFLPIRADL